MLCHKCQTQNQENAQFCTSCGNPLTGPPGQTTPPPNIQPQVSYTPQPAKSSKLPIILVGLFIFLLVLGGGGIFLVSKIRQNLAPNLSTPTTPQSTTTSSSYCQQVYQDLLKKYGEDYQSCLTSINASASACQKPTGLGDQFKDNLNILVILDSSGSMAQNVSGGQKMMIAKNVITNFVNSLPRRTKIGLMVYGHKGSNDQSQKAISCAGIDMVYPISELNKDQFLQAVNSFNPTGWTPIASSFQKAKEILSGYPGETNSNLVYLVSDGLETCNGDPVSAAKDLNQSNIKAIVNIVGFNVDNQAQQQLKVAAEAGGGQYYQANSADDMNKVFNDQGNLLHEYNVYWMCNVEQQNSIWLNLTHAQNNIWLCITEKSNKEWMNITETTNNWPYDDPKSTCLNYVDQTYKERENNIDKWKADTLDKIQQRKDVTLQGLENELRQVTQQQK